MKVFLQQGDTLSSAQQQSFDLLYGPLMSNEAYRLYLFLMTLSQLKTVLDYQMIANALDFDLDELESYRKEIETLSLLETYEKDNQHYLILHKPLDYYEFKNHQILGRFFIKKHSAARLQEIVALLSGQRFSSLENNISQSLDLEVLNGYDKEHEQDYQNISKHHSNQKFNMEVLLNLCGDIIFPKKLRTKAILALIESYASAYNIPYQSLKKYIDNAIPVDQSTFDQETFKKLASINHQPLPKGDPYSWPPEKFLASLQDGLPVINSDLYLLRDLKEKYGFNYEVINVLIEYVIKHHEGSLARSIVEKIASSWKRAKVGTREQAQDILKKTTSSPRKKSSRKVITIEKEQPLDEISLTEEESQEIIEKIKEQGFI